MMMMMMMIYQNGESCLIFIAQTILFFLFSTPDGFSLGKLQKPIVWQNLCQSLAGVKLKEPDNKQHWSVKTSFTPANMLISFGKTQRLAFASPFFLFFFFDLCDVFKGSPQQLLTGFNTARKMMIVNSTIWDQEKNYWGDWRWMSRKEIRFEVSAIQKGY